MFFKFKKLSLLTLFLCIFVSLGTINCFATAPSNIKDIYFESTQGYEPYQIDEKDNLTGFEIELTNTIYKDSGYIVNYENNDNKRLGEEEESAFLKYRADNLYSDKYSIKSDIVYNQSFAVFTLEKKQYKNLTYAKLNEMKVGVLKESSPKNVALSYQMRTISFGSALDGINALKNGKIDAWFGEVDNANYIFIQENIKSLIHYHEELAYNKPMYLILPNNNLDLVKFTNSRIAEIKDSGEFESIYMKYFLAHSQEYQANQKMILIIKIFALVALIVIVVCVTVFRKIKKMMIKNKFSNTITKSILNHGNRFIVLWKSDYSYFEVNSYFKNTFGLKTEVMPPEIFKCFGKKYENFLKNASSADIDNIINSDSLVSKSKDANGNIKEIMWTPILISSKNNVKTILSIGSDMTEKNRLKRELKLSDERYQIAMESADIAIIFVDKGGNVPYLSDVGFNLMGLEKNNSINIEVLLNRIHPNDRDAFTSNILDCSNNLKQFSACEVRVLSKDEDFRWFTFKFKLINNPTTGDPCMAGAFYDINDDKEKDLRIEKLAFEDDLTGIYNRQKFLSVVKETLINAKFNNLRYAVVTLNLDKFHRFNDLFGVETGDGILKAVADIIKYNPYGKDCCCARLGNDEFACLIRLDRKEEHLEQYINELSERIKEFSQNQYDEMKLTISAGACIYMENVEDYHDVFERSIFSMRIAKNDPNKIYQAYDSSIKEMILKREVLEKEIVEAVEKKQFELYYQPKVDIHTEKIVGAEALIRWNHPTRGIVGPMEFIPVAEEIGIIDKIGLWTLETACKQNKLWQEQGLTNIKVSVNITSIEFYQTDIVGVVKTTLEQTGLEPKWLEIELTESMALVDVEETILKMNALRELGVGISMDDFGTGYSSLSYIQNLPIDELKLDKSFINKIALDDTTKNIISAIINLAKIIGLVVVAEGVEEREQFNLLKEMNCNIIQGYLFAKPLKKDEIIKMM